VYDKEYNSIVLFEYADEKDGKPRFSGTEVNETSDAQLLGTGLWLIDDDSKQFMQRGCFVWKANVSRGVGERLEASSIHLVAMGVSTIWALLVQSSFVYFVDIQLPVLRRWLWSFVPIIGSRIYI
jgi:hypothetical protein